jgi:hypothetical protein
LRDLGVGTEERFLDIAWDDDGPFSNQAFDDVQTAQCPGVVGDEFVKLVAGGG